MIFFFIRRINRFVLGFSLLFFAFFIYDVIKHGIREHLLSDFSQTLQREVGSFRNIAVVLLSMSFIVTMLLNPAIQQLVGINNLLLKDSGQYCFYIEVDGNLYPALIRIDTEEEEVDETRTKKIYHYYLDQAVLRDGEVYYFDDELNLNKKTYVSAIRPSGDDYDDNISFSCILRNKHAYSPALQETNDINAINLIFLIIEMSSISFALVGLLRKEGVQSNS